MSLDQDVLAAKRLAKRIRQERIRAKLTQEDLAAMTGLKQSTLSRIESGDRKVEALVLVAIARALSQSVQSLLEDAPADSPDQPVGATPGQRQLIAAAIELAEDMRFIAQEVGARGR